jgi:hypothetical protein
MRKVEDGGNDSALNIFKLPVHDSVCDRLSLIVTAKQGMQQRILGQYNATCVRPLP